MSTQVMEEAQEVVILVVVTLGAVTQETSRLKKKGQAQIGHLSLDAQLEVLEPPL